MISQWLQTMQEIVEHVGTAMMNFSLPSNSMYVAAIGLG